MKKILLIFWLTIRLVATCYSQGQGDTRIFGDSSGVQFISGQPLSITSAINTGEGCASISDNQGNLLFYNGSTGLGTGPNYYNTAVWDRNHQLMPNGTLLAGSSTSTQGCLILPFPNDSNLYYVFNLDWIGNHLFYSVIDLAQNGGFGDVIFKNNLVCDSTFTEKMFSIKHANGRDWWIILHHFGTNNFYEFIVTPFGISGPFIHSIGNSINNDGHPNSGQLVANVEGTKIGYANSAGQLNIFDFDRCTGLLSNFVELNDTPFVSFTSFYGCSFSSNSSKFYASTLDTLFQYDLAAVNIKASKILIYVNPSLNYSIGQHLLSRDNKIYLSIINYNSNYCDSLRTHLSVINAPDTLGLGCNFSPLTFQLSNCSSAYIGLPNMPNYNLGKLTGSVCDTVTAVTQLSKKYSIAIYPNPAHETLHIDFNLQRLNAVLQIIQLDGRNIANYLIDGTKSIYDIDISNIKPGIYDLRFINNSGLLMHKKIVVLH